MFYLDYDTTSEVFCICFWNVSEVEGEVGWVEYVVSGTWVDGRFVWIVWENRLHPFVELTEKFCHPNNYDFACWRRKTETALKKNFDYKRNQTVFFQKGSF